MTTKYRTPEAKAWVKIAERFDAGKEPYGLCAAARVQLGHFSDPVIGLFEPADSMVDGGYYWPTRHWHTEPHTPKHDEYRVYAALLIAAMCDTGDAYP